MAEQSGAYGGDLKCLLEGKAPETGETLREITVGLDSLTGFIRKHYFESFIPEGGSKIKFITGRPGCGKTHFIRCLLDEAENAGFLAVSFSARDVWLHDFREVYLEIYRQCDIEHVLTGCAGQIIREMGYDPAAVEKGKTFLDFLVERGEGDALSKGEIRSALRRFFTKNPLLDNCFASCCSLLTGGILGHPVLESASRELILSYLNGEKGVKLSQLRALGLSPAPVTKYNARHLLRSLAEVIRLAGWQGLAIAIDDMEVLLDRSQGSPMRYTRLRREDTYESIRQLIDDIDSMRNVMFLMGFDRELLDNDSFGMKAYQALWLRVQNEVVSTRFNRFSDIIDLDRYGDGCYSLETLCLMGEKLALFLQKSGIEAAPLGMQDAEGILRRAQFGGMGLPYLVNREVVKGGGGNG